MKKYRNAILITKENFVEIAFMECVSEIRKESVTVKGMSQDFDLPRLVLVVGNFDGTIGDYLVQDVCDNWHIMDKFAWDLVKDDIINEK